MANFRLYYYSEILKMKVGVNVILPESTWGTSLADRPIDDDPAVQDGNEEFYMFRSAFAKQAYSQHKSRALCDLHQHMAHMFLAYFYDNHMDVHALFTGEYSYYDFMVSYASADSLRTAMHYMMKQVKELNTTQFQRSDVEKAKSFILDNITDAITVKNVADHVCLSAEYFTKLFKKETGQNIKEYITQMKVEAAKDLLEHSNISVSMVALELGYTNFSHFSQVFRKYVEVTPSEYRAALRKEEQS